MRDLSLGFERGTSLLRAISYERGSLVLALTLLLGGGVCGGCVGIKDGLCNTHFLSRGDGTWCGPITPPLLLLQFSSLFSLQVLVGP